TGGASGRPILPKSPYQNGAFIIPNEPPVPPGSLYWQLRNLETGSTLQGGTPINGGNSSVGGQGPNGGQGISGGQGANRGQSINGGQGPNGGKGINGGQGPNGGRAQNGGQGINGGHGSNGGQSINGGQAPNGVPAQNSGQGVNGGHGPNGGQGINAGQGPNSSQGLSGGQGPNANSGQQEKIPSLLNIFIKTTDGERGNFGHIYGFFSDFKTYGLGLFLNSKLAGGALSWIAGFKFEKIEGTSNYKVYGKNKLNHKLLDRLYQKYKNYGFNGEEKTLGPNSRRISEARYNAFLKSKKLRTTDLSIHAYVKQSLKTALHDGWNPFTKSAINPKNWFNGNAFNKNFFAKSNIFKMSGPVSYLMASAGTVYDYGWGKNVNKGFGSTDFAADLTTEVAFGVGTTTIGSIASSVATGALAGSLVPGFGTVIGAGAGLLAGVVTSYLINGTATGRKVKKVVSKGIKWAYDGVVSGFRKLGGLFGS
ncbi:MAG: hypothetical protein QJR05_07560, partial [Thermoanaerobacterium sp.]|nr:hypothetical protein [Thermoanaerobacterium sp.]